MGRTEDFEELHELLSGAGGRYRSARATVVHTVDAVVAKEANRRFVGWRFAGGSPGMGIIGKPGPPEPEDFYHEYEDPEEQRIRIWHERPDRWREEIYGADGRLKEVEVHAAAGGPRWIYTRHDPERRDYRAIYVPKLPKSQQLQLRFYPMLDPSDDDFSETFWDEVTVFKTGHEAVFAGRGCVEVRAETISWGYPPCVIPGYNASHEGTTDHLLLVDREIGTILRAAARLEGREFRVAQVEEISYDEGFAEDTFRLELAGVEFERR